MSGHGAGWTPAGLFVVHPWHCDQMGHLTSRHYLGLFDDASHQLMATCGYFAARDVAGGWGWADVRHEIDYRGEAAAGTLIEIRARMTVLGRSSVCSELHMLDRLDGRQLATLRAKTVAFDLETRRAMQLPDDFRRRATDVFGLQLDA